METCGHQGLKLTPALLAAFVLSCNGSAAADSKPVVAGKANPYGYGAFVRDYFERNTPELAFRATNKAQASRWQVQLRSRLKELLGKFPRQACPLDASIIESKELSTRTKDGKPIKYLRQKISFSSRPNMQVVGYFLHPLPAKTPLPCIICPTGHAMLPTNPSNIDELVGIDSHTGKQRINKEGYQKDLALQCVENGYCALAIEQLGFGKRREPIDDTTNQPNACWLPSRIALLCGQTLVGWRTYDLIRSIDYLSTRREVDMKRIATMGVSHGGTISLYASALDQRIKCAVISCVINTLKDEMLDHHHCICIYVPKMRLLCDLPDVAALIAPRFSFFESATKDKACPIAGARKAFKSIQHAYDVMEVPSRTGMAEFDKEHEFDGIEAFRFLKKNL